MKYIITIAVLIAAATGILAGTVGLGWSNSVCPTVTHTRIYYGPAPGTYTNFVAVPVPLNTVTVSNLVDGARYYFAAVAYDGDIESVPSNEVSVKLKPNPPKNLSVTGTGQ